MSYTALDVVRLNFTWNNSLCDPHVFFMSVSCLIISYSATQDISLMSSLNVNYRLHRPFSRRTWSKCKSKTYSFPIVTIAVVIDGCDLSVIHVMGRAIHHGWGFAGDVLWRLLLTRTRLFLWPWIFSILNLQFYDVCLDCFIIVLVSLAALCHRHAIDLLQFGHNNYFVMYNISKSDVDIN